MNAIQKKIPKPTRPENDDCCGGSGCCPCVWDTYFNALDLWEEQQEKEEAIAGAEKATSDAPETD